MTVTDEQKQQGQHPLGVASASASDSAREAINEMIDAGLLDEVMDRIDDGGLRLTGEFLVITGEGDVYSAQEVKDWLDQTGWRIIDRTPLVGPMSLLIAEAVG